MINLKMKLNNIGPHSETKLSDQIKALKIAIFAMNGEGKSFIGRAFSAANGTLSSEESDTLLSLDCNSGSLCFSASPCGEPEKELRINITRGDNPIIINGSPYKFLVFNRDFISENLEKMSYSPSGDCDGYVVGKESIDISKEEELIKSLTGKGTLLREKIETEIKRTQKELQEAGVRPNTTEYNAIRYDMILTKQIGDEAESSNEIRQKINKLKTLPEGTPDIEIEEHEINFAFIDDIRMILEKEFEKASFADGFLEEMRAKRAFIESGMDQIDMQTVRVCPFCKQELGIDSKELLIEYSKYLSGGEAKVNKEIDKQIDNCNRLAQDINEFITKLFRAQTNFNQLKIYFPSFENIQLSPPPNGQLGNDILQELVKKLRSKKKDITKSIIDVEDIISKLSAFIGEYTLALTKTREEAVKLNGAKNRINNELLLLRRRLCNAKRNELIIAQTATIDAICEARLALREAQNTLKEKQAKMKTPKADLISDTFSKLMNCFFFDKYKIERGEHTFSLIFKDKRIGNAAPHILSEGEKSIVAFCYYLASLHAIVENEDDYNNIFFIIDDPISSIDFNYVYAMAQIIRSLKTFFPLIEREKYIIFTHSIEFMGVLKRSKITTKEYSLRSGKFATIKGEIILPYEAHLRDINDVASGTKKPTHTTGNSIRHVLETLWRFERPDLEDLRKYFDTLDDIKDNAFLLYTLGNDLSHGAFRLEYPVDESIIANGCAALIAHMEKAYSGQIAQIRKAGIE